MAFRIFSVFSQERQRQRHNASHAEAHPQQFMAHTHTTHVPKTLINKVLSTANPSPVIERQQQTAPTQFAKINGEAHPVLPVAITI